MKEIILNEKGNGGIGVLGLLGVVFVTLKLVGTIDWSWWWVTAPFWGGLVLTILVIFILIVLKAWSGSRRW